MEEEAFNLTELLLNSINEIFSKLFSSIDNTIYSLLDDLTFIDTSIIKQPSIKRILGESTSSGILLICNSLVLGFIVYYAINYLISHLTYSKIDSPKQFIFKSIIFISVMNSSLWICEEIINLVSLISSSISELSLNLFGKSATFANFIETLNQVIYLNHSEFELFSFDGIVKSFTTFGFFNLIFTYSLRYILIQIFIIISPFAFLSLILNSSEWFFKVWIRNFISLLFTQILISIILLLAFSINISLSGTLKEILYVGIIFALTKANNYMKELFGSISSTVQLNMSGFH